MTQQSNPAGPQGWGIGPFFPGRSGEKDGAQKFLQVIPVWLGLFCPHVAPGVFSISVHFSFTGWEGMGCKVGLIWFQILVWPLASYVTLGMSFNSQKIQFSFPGNGSSKERIINVWQTIDDQGKLIESWLRSKLIVGSPLLWDKNFFILTGLKSLVRSVSTSLSSFPLSTDFLCSWLQPYWPSFCPSLPCTFLPYGLCRCCSLCLKCSLLSLLSQLNTYSPFRSQFNIPNSLEAFSSF